MSAENDRFLELISNGNTLDALNHLAASAGGSGSRRLSLNYAIFGPVSEDNLARIREEETRLLQIVDSLAGREKAETLYNLGCFALVQDDILGARLRFSEAVKQEPENIMARHNLACAHELLAETSETRAQYEKILAQNPESLLTRINLALLNLQEAQYEEALADLERMWADHPGNMGIMLYLCRGLLQRATPDDVDRALSLLDGESESGSYPELLECRGYALSLREDTQGAEAIYTNLLGVDPNNQFALMGMIKSVGQTKDFETLQGYVERYQSLNHTEKMEELLAELNSRD